MGGWVKPQLGFFFFGGGGRYCVFFLLSCFKKKKKLYRGWAGVICTIRVFLGFLDFFNLTRSLRLIGSKFLEPCEYLLSDTATHGQQSAIWCHESRINCIEFTIEKCTLQVNMALTQLTTTSRHHKLDVWLDDFRESLNIVFFVCVVNGGLENRHGLRKIYLQVSLAKTSRIRCRWGSAGIANRVDARSHAIEMVCIVSRHAGGSARSFMLS